MRVRNVHERVLPAEPARVGALIDGLASPEDALWPRELWPAMVFDRPLGVGAAGGHGPIRYTVESYEPGRKVVFRFTAPRGFEGTHGYEVLALDEGRTRLRQVLEMRAAGPALLSWPLVFRPLHDALIEDSLDLAARAVGDGIRSGGWSWWVQILRWVLSRGRARSRPKI